MSTENIISITLIIANLATILVGMIAGAKVIWLIAKMDSRIDTAKDTAVRAHKRIDDIEKYSHNKNGIA